LIVSKETSSACISSIALVDTNVKTFVYNIPIGCNDDSLESIGFMNSIISQYILRFKYKKVLIWYYFNRNIKKTKTILDWLQSLVKLKKKINYRININDIEIPNSVNYYSKIKKGLNFFFGRSYTSRLYLKKKEKKNDNIFLDLFYDVNKIFLYNRFKVLNYAVLSYKYKIKFKRYKYLNKIEGLSSFKSFINNFVKLNGFINKKKRIKIKKRIKMARKYVTKGFKLFFVFIFFYYLNKFNIIIDTYKQRFNLASLFQIYKNTKKKRFKYKYRKNKLYLSKYKYNYIFKYKSKKIYKKKKSRKFGFLHDSFDILKKTKFSISFLFFY
jgi:hypothetical protein